MKHKFEFLYLMDILPVNKHVGIPPDGRGEMRVEIHGERVVTKLGRAVLHAGAEVPGQLHRLRAHVHEHVVLGRRLAVVLPGSSPALDRGGQGLGGGGVKGDSCRKRLRSEI